MRTWAFGLGFIVGGLIGLPLLKEMWFPAPFVTIPLGIILILIDQDFYKFIKRMFENVG